jgi:hypothetical protein
VPGGEAGFATDCNSQTQLLELPEVAHLHGRSLSHGIERSHQITTAVYLTGMHLMGVHLMGMHLIGVHLMGVHLMGVYLIGVYLIGVHLICVHLTGV